MINPVLPAQQVLQRYTGHRPVVQASKFHMHGERDMAGVQDHHSDHNYYQIDNGEKVKLPNPHSPDLTYREFHNIIGKAGMTSLQFYKRRARTSVWRQEVPRSPVLSARFGSKGNTG